MKLFLIFAANFLAVCGKPNNVCKHFYDYATLLINPNCYYNPDVDSTGLEQIRRNGFEVETYTAKTEDGYVNTLFRIPGEGQPVILNHGLAVSSDIWLDIGDRSMAYFLVRQGYDVWIANFRGTRPYSQKHVEYAVDNPKFWNFSFDQVGIYDVPSNLEVVKRVTGKRAIYVGHSQGTTVVFVYMAEMPEHARLHMKGVIALSPVAYANEVPSLIRYLVPFRNIIWALSNPFFHGGIGKAPLISNIGRLICSGYPAIRICEFLMFTVLGFDYNQTTAEDLIIAIAHAPNGASVKSLVHYAQVMERRGKFRKFDYGRRRNLKAYGTPEPPDYDLKRFPLCVNLIYGRADYLSDPKDVLRLHENLTCSTLDAMAPGDGPAFNHQDFVYGKDVQTLLYPTIMQRLNEINSRNEN